MRTSIQNAIAAEQESIEIPWLNEAPRAKASRPVADVDWGDLVQQSNRYKLRHMMPRLDGVPTVGDYFELMKWTRSLLFCFKAHQNN